jgi:hypothetical protein
VATVEVEVEERDQGRPAVGIEGQGVLELLDCLVRVVQMLQSDLGDARENPGLLVVAVPQADLVLEGADRLVPGAASQV